MNLMLDLETASTCPNAAVVQIAANEFNPHTGESFRTFCRYIDLDDSSKYGVVCPETMRWWGQQPSILRAKVFGGKQTLKQALTDFSLFLEGKTYGNVWAMGSSADNVWIRHLYTSTGLTIPHCLNFRNDACLRTMLRYLPKEEWPKPTGLKHNAVNDCLHQIKLLQAVYKKLNLI